MIPRAIYQCIIHNTIGRIGQCSCSASIRDAIPDTSIAFTISYLSHLLYTSNCYACLHVYIGHIEEEIITSHGSGILHYFLVHVRHWQSLPSCPAHFCSSTNFSEMELTQCRSSAAHIVKMSPAGEANTKDVLGVGNPSPLKT